MPDNEQPSSTIDLRKPQISSSARRPRRLWPIWLGLGLLLLIGATGLAIKLLQESKNPFPAKIRQGLHFNLYYPQNLPNGYTIDRTSFTRKENSIIFVINTPIGKNIVASEQALPLGDAIELGPPDPPPGSPINLNKHIDVPAGKAVIGLWGANFVSSIVTDQTWIILNCNGLTTDQAAVVTRTFIKVP